MLCSQIKCATDFLFAQYYVILFLFNKKHLPIWMWYLQINEKLRKNCILYYTVNLILHYIFFALVMNGKRPSPDSPDGSLKHPCQVWNFIFIHVYALKGEKAFRSSLKFRCHTYNWTLKHWFRSLVLSTHETHIIHCWMFKFSNVYESF